MDISKEVLPQLNSWTSSFMGGNGLPIPGNGESFHPAALDKILEVILGSFIGFIYVRVTC